MASILGSRYRASMSLAISRKFKPKSSIRVPSGTAKSAGIRTRRPRNSRAEAIPVDTFSLRKIVARCSSSLGTCDWMPGFQGPYSLSGSIELGAGIELGAVRIHTQRRNLAALQLLLQVLPVVEHEQIGVFLSKTAARKFILELHAVFDLLGKEDHALLEKPARHPILTGFAVGIGANLHVGQFFDGIIIEQIYAAIAAHAVIPGIQILVENVGGGIVANAMSEACNDRPRLALRGALQVHRQRNDLELHDQ